MFDFDNMTPVYSYDDLIHPNGKPKMLLEKLRAIGLKDNDIAKVWHAIETTCHECWDYEWYKCTCTRDE